MRAYSRVSYATFRYIFLNAKLCEATLLARAELTACDWLRASNPLSRWSDWMAAQLIIIVVRE